MREPYNPEALAQSAPPLSRHVVHDRKCSCEPVKYMVRNVFLKRIHRRFEVFDAVPVERRPADIVIQPVNVRAVELGLRMVRF